MLLSVVIPTLNSANTIRYTLSSLFSNNLSRDVFEVIVVDNGSIDNTVDVAEKFPAKIYSCPIHGQGPARNLGISKAQGDIICFTDSDVIVPKDWLQKILDFFDTHPNVDGVGGPVLAPLSSHINNLQKMDGEIYSETHIFPTRITKSRFRDKRTALNSANCSYRKEILFSVNGFDTSILDAVDIDLCWRLIRSGKCLIFNPDIKVIHFGSPWNLRGIFNQQFRWGISDIELKKRHPHKSSIKEKFFPYYSLVRLSLFLLSPKHKNKKLLRFFEICAFDCGRIYALTHNKRAKNEQNRAPSLVH